MLVNHQAEPGDGTPGNPNLILATDCDPTPLGMSGLGIYTNLWNLPRAIAQQNIMPASKGSSLAIDLNHGHTDRAQHPFGDYSVICHESVAEFLNQKPLMKLDPGPVGELNWGQAGISDFELTHRASTSGVLVLKVRRQPSGGSGHEEWRVFIYEIASGFGGNSYYQMKWNYEGSDWSKSDEEDGWVLGRYSHEYENEYTGGVSAWYTDAIALVPGTQQGYTYAGAGDEFPAVPSPNGWQIFDPIGTFDMTRLVMYFGADALHNWVYGFASEYLADAAIQAYLMVHNKHIWRERDNVGWSTGQNHFPNLQGG